MKKRNNYMTSDKNIRLWIKGLKLVLMESQGDQIKIDCSNSTKTFFAKSGIDANKLLVDIPQNWIVFVTAVIKDIHGNYDAIVESEIFMGTKIDDTAPKVLPMLDAIKDGLNEKLVVDHGWVAEVLPTKRFVQKHDEEAYKAKAEQYIEDWIISKHIERESVA